MTTFTVYPAIDLRAGNVVRLRQGDPGRETAYSAQPGQVAARWVGEGAQWLHVVNLDGALGVEDRQYLTALDAILDQGVPVQFGGGVRSLAMLELLLERGVARVMLGTAAVTEPMLLARAAARFGGDRIAVSMDLRDGKLQIRGWQEGSAMDPEVLGWQARQLGIRTAVVTDVTRDGMGRGLNLDLACRLASACRLSVIAAGGATSLDDVRRAKTRGMAGVVLGRALYEGQLQLREALTC